MNLEWEEKLWSWGGGVVALIVWLVSLWLLTRGWAWVGGALFLSGFVIFYGVCLNTEHFLEYYVYSPIDWPVVLLCCFGWPAAGAIIFGGVVLNALLDGVLGFVIGWSVILAGFYFASEVALNPRHLMARIRERSHHG